MVYRSPPKFINSHGSEILAEHTEMLPLAACTDVRPGNEAGNVGQSCLPPKKHFSDARPVTRVPA